MTTGWRFWAPAATAVGAYLLGVTLDTRVVFVLVDTVAVGIIWLGTRRNWTSNARAGRLLASAATFWVAGAWLFTVQGTDSPASKPLTWVIYAVLALGYAAVIGSILAVGNRRRTGIAEMLEAGVISVGLGLLTWIYVVPIDTVWRFDLEAAPLVLFAHLDLFCMVLAVFLYRQIRAVSPATTTLMAGLFFVLLSYYLFNSFGFVVPMADVEFFSAIGTAGYALIAVATLEPPRSNDALPTSLLVSRIGPSSGRVALLSAALFVAPVVMAIELVRGTPLRDWGSVIVVASIVLSGLSSARLFLMLARLRGAAKELQRSSLTDALTGLGNRRRLDEVLGTLTARERGEIAALMVIDIDRFSEINDTFGYTVGDRVLVSVGDRIAATTAHAAPGRPGMSAPVGEVLLVARLGGDEFAVILDRCTTAAAVVGLARTVQSSMGVPIELDDIDLTMDVTVGIAFLGDFPETGSPPADVLLQHAHLAATEAKLRQPRLAVYDREMDVDRRDQLRLMSDLSLAVRSDQLVLHFQPFLDLRTGEAARLECLLRWQHPQVGLLYPDAFLPSAEQTSLMPAITAWVIDAALSQCRQWRRIGLEAVVAVNLSARNLVDPTLPQQVRDALTRHRVPPSGLVLEVTETSAMLDPASSIVALRELRSIGVSLAIDDYGVGYTSLAYLDELPVQQLKIDRAFVTGMTRNPVSAAIVSSTVDLARNLGLTVVAEGVEDAQTLGALRAIGCDSAQGYFIGAPVPAADVLPLIGAIATS